MNIAQHSITRDIESAPAFIGVFCSLALWVSTYREVSVWALVLVSFGCLALLMILSPSEGGTHTSGDFVPDTGMY